MRGFRTYGREPFTVAVIHGGPGAPGEMAPAARELSKHAGVLEPLQTKATVQGQVEELKNVLEKNGVLPITLIGFSWGAWLSFFLAAQYPRLVQKLILISCPPFEHKYADCIMKIRLSRLNEKERKEALSLMMTLETSLTQDKNRVLLRFGRLMSKADSYDPICGDIETVECQYDVYQSVWEEAERLRKSGQLLALARKVQCPVVAIHGDCDSHPTEGVRVPLSSVMKDFRFILLEKCGHRPWLERDARERFYGILRAEI